MSRTYKDISQSSAGRTVYRCAECGSEKFSRKLPEGWRTLKQQLAGRHTVWCDCGSH